MLAIQRPVELVETQDVWGWKCRTDRVLLSSLEAGIASIKLEKPSSSYLDVLPEELVCYILSFLNVRSLCHLARTCVTLEKLTSDPILWRNLLKRDTLKWSVIGHLSHPQVYLDAASDLHPKTVYSQCYRNRRCVPVSSFAFPVTIKLKWFLRRLQGNVPKVVMFGSGLESLPFVRMLMWEQTSPYKPIGLVPGKDGIGSGFCVEHTDGSPVNLVTLYRAAKADRKLEAEKMSKERINRLMTPSLSHDSNTSHLIAAVSELCRHADAFMLILDSSSGPSCEDGRVLSAMLQSARAEVPLLVASVNQSDAQCQQPPIVVADQLQLCRLANHPWQVRSIALESFAGLPQGLHWLLGKET